VIRLAEDQPARILPVHSSAATRYRVPNAPLKEGRINSLFLSGQQTPGDLGFQIDHCLPQETPASITHLCNRAGFPLVFHAGNLTPVDPRVSGVDTRCFAACQPDCKHGS
jgi:hypothetical protein